jgi:hypothetical protein
MPPELVTIDRKSPGVATCVGGNSRPLRGMAISRSEAFAALIYEDPGRATHCARDASLGTRNPPGYIRTSIPIACIALTARSSQGNGQRPCRIGTCGAPAALAGSGAAPAGCRC